MPRCRAQAHDLPADDRRRRALGVCLAVGRWASDARRLSLGVASVPGAAEDVRRDRPRRGAGVDALRARQGVRVRHVVHRSPVSSFWSRWPCSSSLRGGCHRAHRRCVRRDGLDRLASDPAQIGDVPTAARPDPIVVASACADDGGGDRGPATWPATPDGTWIVRGRAHLARHQRLGCEPALAAERLDGLAEPGGVAGVAGGGAEAGEA